ncbi:asparaginase [Elizabethkingia anophelis]|uniref:Asparaginase n=1 Tax=Elizabethkingia anophelis R26 TaxID=1246994 RepID=A0ABM6MSH0_9FLAO|nr:asparaginase [Elizabethkingia anophelis]ATC36065.1 asparaginase [Elizabethkingia anophelis R26]ATC39742.1 asparaginase [Elizabethkingia anophelis Ag1]ATC43421.1 asparaginase [Elizabethkingia anophelis]ATC47097.1 asparaginase [Elizabethkingia anophelis]ELR79677.1 L-asparaginase [Elizabethkingia anophelis R26]
MKRKVLIIYTGGTIGMEKDYESGSLKAFDFSTIANRIPEINLLDCDVTLSQFSTPLDSSDVGPEHWTAIAKIIKENYEDFSGFLILHGTDTMAYTASALSFMLKGLRKPVILTGSQLPIGDLRTDAKENLLTSLYYASFYDGDEAVIQEVALYFEYKLLRGNRCIKASAENFDAFKTPNYPILGQSGVNLEADRNILYRAPKNETFDIDLHISKKVFLIWIFPGMNLNEVESFIKASEIKVLILRVFGSGTFFSDKNIENILLNIRANGTEIVIISQCISGEISVGKYDNSNIFKRIGAISGGDLTAESALTKAMHLIENPHYKESFSTLFSKSLRGEMSN